MTAYSDPTPSTAEGQRQIAGTSSAMDGSKVEVHMRDDRVLPAHAGARGGDRAVPGRRVRAAVLLPRRHAPLVRVGRAADDHAADHGRGLHRRRVLLRARRARDALASDPRRLPAGDGVHAVHGDRDVQPPRSLRHGSTSRSGSGSGCTSPRRCSCRWRGGATARPIRGTPEPGEPPLPRLVRPLLLAVGAVQSLGRARAAALAVDDDRALAVAADAADGADARRVVRAARA